MTKKIKGDTLALAGTVKSLIDDCETDHDQRRGKRLRALDYYNGRMADVPSEEGRSSIVSKDVRSAIKKLMPSIKRVLLGSDTLVEFKPVGPDDEDKARQATEYMNGIVLAECHADEEIADAIQSALLLDEGVLKWWFEDKKVVSVSMHTGLLAEEVAVFEQNDDVEILSRESQIEKLDDGQEVEFFSIRVKRTHDEKKICLAAVPIEDFGMHADARSIEDAAIVYHRTRVRKGDLIARGIPAEIVDGLPEAQDRVDDDDERYARDIDMTRQTSAYQGVEDSMQLVEVYECFIRTDFDGDGIAELREVHYVENGETSILFNDYADEVRFAVLVAERIPHSAKGVSVFDDVEDIQKMKTVLTRQTLDNLYWQNNPQPIMQEGVVQNPEAVFDAGFGQAIRVRQGTSAVDAIKWNSIPYFADKSLTMLDKADQVITDRTGITSASSGLDPNVLQNVREQGVQMISDAASAQAWCIVNQFAKGLKRAFRGLLRLSIQHQDKPRTLRMSDGQWTSYDPRHWNAEMDCEVNVGLGTGTRERDLAALAMVEQTMTAMISAFGPANPFVTPENIYNLAAAKVRGAGLASPDKFFTKPPEGTRLGQQGPSPEQQKMEFQIQLEDKKMAVQRDKESAQAEADVLVKQAEAQRDAQKAALESEQKQAERDDRIMIEREKIESAERIAREKMANDRMLAAMNKGGEDAPGLDLETGQPQPSRMETLTEMVASLALSMREMQSAIHAPRVTEIIRDEHGRAAGAVQRIGNNEMVN